MTRGDPLRFVGPPDRPNIGHWKLSGVRRVRNETRIDRYHIEFLGVGRTRSSAPLRRILRLMLRRARSLSASGATSRTCCCGGWRLWRGNGRWGSRSISAARPPTSRSSRSHSCPASGSQASRSRPAATTGASGNTTSGANTSQTSSASHHPTLPKSRAGARGPPPSRDHPAFGQFSTRGFFFFI